MTYDLYYTDADREESGHLCIGLTTGGKFTDAMIELGMAYPAEAPFLSGADTDDDGWIVTPDEIEYALNVLEGADTSKVSPATAEVLARTDWREFLAFMSRAHLHGGFRVR